MKSLTAKTLVFVPYRGLFNFNPQITMIDIVLAKVFVPYRGLFNFNSSAASIPFISGVFVPYRGLFNFNPLPRIPYGFWALSTVYGANTISCIFAVLRNIKFTANPYFKPYGAKCLFYYFNLSESHII